MVEWRVVADKASERSHDEIRIQDRRLARLTNWTISNR
ncbi:hypothetical protein NPIL_303351, partial [Nephila pilipes]